MLGNWVTLFYITAFITILLPPFIYPDLILLFHDIRAFFFLLMTSVVIFFAALLDFQALKLGKISIIEPIYSLEIPVTAMLAAFIINEHLSTQQLLLVVSLFFGIALLSLRSFHDFRRASFEKGIWYALLATLGMGAANFLFGVGAREINPLVVNWFTSCFIVIICLLYFISRGQLRMVASYFTKNKVFILSVGAVDNLAWIAYSYSTLYIPIAVATSISESYIILASFLGLIFNKERLVMRQYIGQVIAVISVIALARITPNL